MAYNPTNDPSTTGSAGVVTAFILVIVGLILGYLIFNYGGFNNTSPGNTINVDLPNRSGGGVDIQGTQ